MPTKFIEKFHLIPDVIEKVPKVPLKVRYGGNLIKIGEILTPSQVKLMPELFWKVEEGALYTVCMTDPDAPRGTAPKYREWQHWLVVNIPELDIKKGDTLSEYVGAAPPKGTGLHRYVILVYKQNGRINCDEKRLSNKMGAGREKFAIRAFARKYNLGYPVAASVFLGEWDDYVPKIQNQLQGCHE